MILTINILNKNNKSIMKAKNLGRLELLSWLNETVEADYPKIELCSDAIGYSYVIDAINPGVVAL
jgi:hypothetical protein